MSEAARVSLFNHAQQVHLEGSPFTVQNCNYTRYHEGTKGGGFKALRKATAHAAFHNSGERNEPPKCHPHTRDAILKKIMAWVKGEIDEETFVFWLNGSLGVGKSAIAQTIAEMCEKEGLLLASFFFARSDATRNNTKQLITTLAYQIALAAPPVRSHMEQIFEHDPLINTRSLDTQAAKLLIEPLERAIADQIHIPPLIVIDGLDECHDKSEQCKVLDIVSRVGGALNVASRRLVFLVVSRPEQDISLKFNSRTLQDVSTQYSINTSPDSDADILRFLEDGFNEIKSTHPLKSSIPPAWPSIHDLRTLMWLAGGQFLYATLALSYTSSIRHRPTDRLATVLHAGADADDNPFTALDTLYHHIFSTIVDVESLLTILGFHMSSPPPRGHIVSKIINERLGKEFEDVTLLFGDLSSVVNVYVNDDEYGSWSLKFRHVSLEDFLKNQKRSRQYHIKTESYHTEWAIWLLNQTPNVQLTGDNNLLLLCYHSCWFSPSPGLHGVLQACNLVDLYPRYVWEDAGVIYVHPIEQMYSIISSIRSLAFDDAESLYQLQLGAFKRHIGSLLGSCNTRPLTSFTLYLLLSTSALQLEALPPGLDFAFPVLNRIFQISTGHHPNIFSPKAFYSFLSTLIQDSDADCSTPLHGAVNSIRAAAAPVLLHYLSQPPELTHSPPFKWSSERFKARPWMLRRRFSIHNNLKIGTWCKFQRRCKWCLRHSASQSCFVPHDDPASIFQTWAYISSSSRQVITLHCDNPLLAYFYALVLLPEVLAKAPRSEELIASCKAHIFHHTCILFPRGTKSARAAILKYLKRVEAEEQRWEELWLD